MSQYKVDLTNPYYGRRYLKCFKSEKDLGIIFKKKSYYYPKNLLNFSILTNKLGLKGSSNVNSNKVVCGTSFTIGIGVDEDECWYNKVGDQDFFNAGFPTGVINHKMRLKKFYTGNYETLIFIYHPNTLYLDYKYTLAYKEGGNIFEVLNWKTSLISLPRLYIKWKARERIKESKGIIKYVNDEFGNKKKLDFSYCNHNFDEKIIDQYTMNLESLINSFKTVILFRIPIKELLYLKDHDMNSKTLESYNKNWSITEQIFRSHENCTIYDLINEFTLSDYNEKDTHWNEKGNLKFSTIFNQYL
jgi:hypothetical protein